MTVGGGSVPSASASRERYDPASDRRLEAALWWSSPAPGRAAADLARVDPDRVPGRRVFLAPEGRVESVEVPDSA